MKKLTTLAAVAAAASLSFGLAGVAVATPQARISGTDRYDTSLNIAKQYFSAAKTVVLATGMNYPDALAAGPLAAKEKAPILLVGKSLSADQLAYLQKLLPKKAYLIGGDSVLPSGVEKQLEAIKGLEVERIFGKDRFETAKMISEKFAKPAEYFVASGMNFPDALAGGAYAASKGSPLLLVGPGHEATVAGKATIFGGEQVVPDSMVKSAEPVTRIGGKDRYDTAAQIAKLQTGAKGAFLVSGVNFPDALTAVPAAAIQQMPLYLAKPDCSPVVTDLPLTFVGGTAALQDSANLACVAQRTFQYRDDGSNGKNLQAKDLISFDLAKKTIRAYYSADENGIANKVSSRYIEDVTSIAAEAAPRIAKACQDAVAQGKKPAAVFDADDTTLWTYDMEDNFMNLQFTPKGQDEWFAKNQMPATPGMVALVKQVKAAGCEIIGLTGRNDAQKDYTVKNLKDAGYVDEQGNALFQADKYFTKFLKDKPMPKYLQEQKRCDLGKNKCNTVQFKAGTRQYIQEKLGYQIVGNFGDQWSDLMGGQADNWVKLPNPTYYLPSPNLPEWEAKDTAAGMQPSTLTWTIRMDGSTGSLPGTRDTQIPNIDMVKSALKAANLPLK